MSKLFSSKCSDLLIFAKAALALAAAGFWLPSCAHQVSVISEPGDAAVYYMNPDSSRGAHVGQTPIQLMGRDLNGANGVIVAKPGYEAAFLYLPSADFSDLSLRVKLTPLDRSWVEALPDGLSAELQNEALNELLQLQSDLFSRPLEELEAKLAALEQKFGHLSAFHYLLGNFFFYKEDHPAAARAFSRAVELDPSNERAKEMLVVNQLKAVESSRAAKVQSFQALAAAARRVASLAGGALASTRSHPNLPEPDGLRIIIPSDPLFLPASSKMKAEGRKMLQQIRQELGNITQSFAVHVGAHTDADPHAEFALLKPLVFQGKKASRSPWQLSGERAAAVMLFLRAAGLPAQSWSIAGYGDSEPLVTPSGSSMPGLSSPAVNRRVEIQVSIYKGPNEKSFSDAELESLKRSLDLFVSETQEPEEDSGQQKGQPQGGAPFGGGGSSAGRTPQAQERANSTGAAGGTADPAAAAAARAEMEKRRLLEQRLRKPPGRTEAEGQALSSDPTKVPQPRVPKLSP
jgi:flagellar motor protein MotB